MANELLLYGTVGASFWDEEYFTAKTVREALAGMTGDVTVRINSGGGIATEGQAIYTALKNHDGQISVVIEGIAASAASLIAMAGDTITMSAGSIMMVHDPASMWTEGRGTEEDHLRVAKVLCVIANAYAGLYAARAGISTDEARAVMKAETYFDGPAAVEAGFADSATEDGEAIEPAAFDYRLYAKAPAKLRDRSASLPARRADASVLAILAGAAKPTATLKGQIMAKQKVTAATAAEDEDMTAAEDEDTEMSEDTGEEDMTAEDEDTSEDDAGEEDDDESEDSAEATAIIRLCARRNLPAARAVDMIARGLSLRAATAELNGKGTKVKTTNHGPSARILRDERDTRRAGMTAALVAQIGRSDPTTGAARPYMQMGIVEMAAQAIGYRGSLRSGGDRVRVMMEAGHATSDFPAIFENALNKVLLDRYTLTQPTFRQIARQRNFRDFRPMPLVRPGDFPRLRPVNEKGEIKFGTFGESKETAVIAPYAIGVNISRQMIINDDLGAIDEVLSSYGQTVALWEETTFYAFALTAVMSDGQQIFHSTHGNLAGTGGAINATTVSAGRAAMRNQKSVDGNNLNITPSILLTGTAQETAAEMFLATITPTAVADVNPFSGRLTPVVTPEVAGNQWFLLSATNPAWVYGYLEGMEAPRLRVEEPFGTQGMAMTLEHDFGLGAADWRGAYRNPGA